MARNKYPEETEQKILDAALKLFLEKGYEETTILDIVDNLGGLTRGAFYHHFKSKEEVLDVLSDKLFYQNNPLEAVKNRTDLNGLEKMKYIMSVLNFEENDSRKISTASLPAFNSPTFLKKFIEDNRNVVSPMCEELIREGAEDGSIATEHPKLLAELFIMLVNFWTIPTIFPSSYEETVEKLIYIKEITDKLGLPILDNDIIDKLKQMPALKGVE